MAPGAIATAPSVGPWPSLQIARSFLRGLVTAPTESPPLFPELNLDTLVAWLEQEGLASLAYHRYIEAWPELAQRLRPDYYRTAMGNTIHLKRLARVAACFGEHDIPFVLLKGAALSQWIYSPDMRPMSDLDLWIAEEKMAAAVHLMVDDGYRLVGKRDRPPQLQRLSDGELALISPDNGLVELHWSPFAGWWLQRTARVDLAALWQRIRPVALGSGQEAADVADTLRAIRPQAYMLDAEDTILHLAVHLAVNHQFGLWGMRSLVDIAMAAQEGVNWEQLAQRARGWRLGTVLWLVLELEKQLVGAIAAQPALQALRPRAWKRGLLRRIVTAQSLLNSDDLRQRWARFGLLLLLTERKRDAVRLVLRTLWPERAWLQARYGEESASYGRHLWHVLRRGAI